MGRVETVTNSSEDNSGSSKGSSKGSSSGGEMPCLVCNAPIAVDPVALLAGGRAVCGGCGTVLRLEPGEGLRQTVERFEAAKREVRQVIGGRVRRRP